MSMVQRVYALAALVALSSCVKSDKIECSKGYSDCGGACVRPAVDSENCGACGKACPSYQVCVGGACVATCESSLHAPLSDAWGYRWDGLERPPATYQEARDACSALGGRLPNVSELLRVSAPLTGAVGDTHKTNPIWTIIPDGPDAAVAISLDDGGTASYAMNVDRPYRCICPAARPVAFSGGACNGPFGSACVPMPGNPRFNFDREDRPAMSKAAAMAECAFVGGELPTAERLVAAVAGGLPNGKATPLHTADDTGHFHADATTRCILRICFPIIGCICFASVPVPAVDEQWEALVSFSSTTPTITEQVVGDPRPFRCFGPAAPGAVAASVAGGWREPGGERTVDGGPEYAATTYTSAIADCFRRGGHLPSATELAAMAIQGLPAGGYAGVRMTSDQALVPWTATFGWSGAAYWPVDPDLATTTPTTDGVPYTWTGSVPAPSLWDVQDADAAGKPYRCLYYGVDPTYAGPAPASCSGGCVEISPGAGTAAGRPRMWFDAQNRGAAGDTHATAVKTCAELGGRLASTRDLVEGIRGGLAFGATVITSELVRVDYYASAAAPLARTLTWTGGSNPTFADTTGTYVPLTQTGVIYRCMWTNEIR